MKVCVRLIMQYSVLNSVSEVLFMSLSSFQRYRALRHPRPVHGTETTELLNLTRTLTGHGADAERTWDGRRVPRGTRRSSRVQRNARFCDSYTFPSAPAGGPETRPCRRNAASVPCPFSVRPMSVQRPPHVRSASVLNSVVSVP